VRVPEAPYVPAGQMMQIFSGAA
jgi:hypothetical protein